MKRKRKLGLTDGGLDISFGVVVRGMGRWYATACLFVCLFNDLCEQRFMLLYEVRCIDQLMKECNCTYVTYNI